MKKLLSFTLAIMLLFALTGCDAFLDHFQKSARTTITEEEWLTAWDSCNYTVNGNASRINTNGEKLETDTITAKVTGTSCFRHQSSGFGTNKTEKKDYYVMIDKADYHILETESGNVAYPVTVGYSDEKFGNVFSASIDPRAIFACLTHTAETGKYTGEYKQDNGTVYSIVAVFADGKITSANIAYTSESLEIYYRFYDFGTTVVILPAYTVAPQ